MRNNLKEYIKASGLKQKHICEKLNIQPAALSHVIKTRRKPSQELMSSLSKILKVSVQNLFPTARQVHRCEL